MLFFFCVKICVQEMNFFYAYKFKILDTSMNAPHWSGLKKTTNAYHALCAKIIQTTGSKTVLSVFSRF